jgi:hypothetical protein
MRLFVLVVGIALLIASPVRAQDVSLIDILVAKGILSSRDTDRNGCGALHVYSE